MDKKRKSEYRYLLYRGMLDVRNSYVAVHWWNPLTWFRTHRTLQRVNAFATSSITWLSSVGWISRV